MEITYLYVQGFPGGSEAKKKKKKKLSNAGDTGSIPRLETLLGEGNGNPLQYYSPEKPMDREAVTAYSSWGFKEQNTIQQLNTTFKCDCSHFSESMLFTKDLQMDTPQ